MRTRKTADERLNEILDYIKSHLRKKGYPPSVRDICDAVGLKSTSTVHSYLGMLEKRGMIRRDPTKPRAIDILEDKPWENNVDVPLVGTVAAGVPVLAEENIEEVYSFPQGLVGTADQVFMLRVDGDSMINIGIFDGDYIIVRPQNTADNGDVVVALVNGDSATCKRFFHEKDCIRLQPENDRMKPFYEKNVKILGLVVGVYRRM